ncbi:MAG: flippase-like domain-containing protein [bacterium]|nr:flippase-like domain-containing protein [bacterium]
MKKYFFAALSVLLGIILFVAAIGYAGLENILGTFKSFSPLFLLLFLFVSSSVHLISVYKWRLILISQGYKIPFRNLLFYKIMGYTISYLTPMARIGGEPLRAYMLKKHHGIRMTKGLPSILLDKSIETTVHILIGGLILISIIFISDWSNEFKLFFAGILIFLILLFSLFYYRLLKKRGVFSTLFSIISKLTNFRLFKRLLIKLSKIDAALSEFMCTGRKCLYQVILLTCVQWVLFFVEIKFALFAIGYDASLLQVFAVVVSVTLAGMLPVPAALGVLEASQFSVFKLLGQNPHLGVVLSLVVRFRDSIWILSGLVLLSHEGINVLEAITNRLSKK